MSPPARHLLLLAVFAALMLSTRLPFTPGQLFAFDDVNLALALGHFDIRLSQPQPPGYPLFVLEMRMLSWLRFKRPESILVALSLIGGTLSLFLLARFGDRMLGRGCGLWASILLLFNPSFWHGGLTSGLRPQLALVSVAVAAACYRAWEGSRRWVPWSAFVLGLGAGVRPELGVFLFPLWAAAVLRAQAGWRLRVTALGVLAVTVLAWLVPCMMASGGPVAYLRNCWIYLTGHAEITSVVAGAAPAGWRPNLWRSVVWVFSGLLAWPLSAALAWRRGSAFGIPAGKLVFLALWLLPSLGFAAFVHVEDAGQSLAMVPIVCLLGGYLIYRASGSMAERISRYHSLVFLLLPVALSLGLYFLHPKMMLLWIPLCCVAAGLILTRALTGAPGVPPRTHSMVFLVMPALVLNGVIFFTPGWYYEAQSGTGFAAMWTRAISDIHNALARTSLAHIRSVTYPDDHNLGEVRRLSSADPNNTLVVCMQSATSWRKLTYYLPELPVLVLDRSRPVGRAELVATLWRGPRPQYTVHGPAPLETPVPASRRIIWLIRPGTEFFRSLSAGLELRPSGPVFTSESPQEVGQAAAGGYVLLWSPRPLAAAQVR